MRKIIYCVSPDYARYLALESAPFSFDVKVFPNCGLAYDNLVANNQSNIIGYVLLYEEIPNDPTELVDFINFINLIGSKDTIVILAIRNAKGFPMLMDYLEVDNIEFLNIIDFEVVTDTFIKRNLFGSILIRKYTPYVDKITMFKNSSTYQSNSNLVPVLPNDILGILSPINRLVTLKHTIEADRVLEDFKDNPLVYYLRLNRIKRLFDEEVDFDGMMDRIESSNVNKILYSVLCVMIEGGY